MLRMPTGIFYEGVHKKLLLLGQIANSVTFNRLFKSLMSFVLHAECKTISKKRRILWLKIKIRINHTNFGVSFSLRNSNYHQSK